MVKYFGPLICLAMLTACMEASDGGLSVTPPENPSPNTSVDEAPDLQPVCQVDTQFMANQVWPRILSQCAACHNSSGLAATSNYILLNDDAEMSSNWQRTQAYESSQPGLLESKSTAQVLHGGGRLIQVGDDNHALMLEMVSRFSTPVNECEGEEQPLDNTEALIVEDLLSTLTLASPSTTLRQASLLLAGRLPTENELATVNESNLKTMVRGLMQGPEFDAFLMEAANDQLLTMKWASDRTPGLSALNGEYFYPMVSSRIQPLEDAVQQAIDDGRSEATIQAAQQAVWFAREQTNLALAQEPLRLMAYIAQQERPYTEVLTANYIMVNPFINDVFATGLNFSDPLNPDDWQPASIIAGYRDRTEALPHAGVLTSPMFLARYPSTDTNRNRARARWTYYFFLGVDIEGLAVRPMNGDSLMDVDNPTLNNPDCAICHEIMDPVAGAFQNWGNDGQFRDQCGWYTDTQMWECDRDALPWVGYKEFGSPYTPGDLWYRDMRTPGFNGSALPASSMNHSLRWLGEEISTDPRFASGSVRFWFKGLLGREPHPKPDNPNDTDYIGNKGAYDIDEHFIDLFAQAFSSGTAGTASHGRYNLKDLFTDMIVSPLFRGQFVNVTLNRNQQRALSNTGWGRLLTPEQLNRKLTALLGRHWEHVWDAERNQLTDDFYGFYGGIDSDGVTDRSREITPLMATVIERFSNEMACTLVVDEFETHTSQRVLLGDVNPTDSPDVEAGAVKIQNAIADLMNRLWGPDATTESELSAAYELFLALRQERIDNEATAVLYTNADDETTDDHDEYCQLDWNNNGALIEDENQVVRPWIGLMVYLLSDYRVLFL